MRACCGHRAPSQRAGAGEVGQQVDRAGDEHGALRPASARAPARAPRPGRPRSRRSGPPSWRQRLSSIAGGSALRLRRAREDDARRSSGSERGEHAGRVLVVEDRQHRDQRALPDERRRARAASARDAGRVVRAVEDRERRRRATTSSRPGVADSRAPRAHRARGRARPGRPRPRPPRPRSSRAGSAPRGPQLGTSPRSRRSRAPAAAAARRARRRPARATAQRLAAERAGDQRAAGGHDRELLLGDVALGRARASACARGSRSSAPARRSGSRWWRRSGRRARPRRRRPRLPPAPAPSRRPRSAPRTASRGRRARACGRPARPPRPRARSPPRSARRTPRCRRPRSRSAQRDEVRRQVGAGAQAVRAPAARRSCAPSTTCRSSPRRGSSAKRSCGEPSAVISRRMRSRPNRMPNISSESQVALRLAQRGRCFGQAHLLYPSSSASSDSKRSSLSRSACTSSGGALSVKPLLESLPRARLDLGPQPLALGFDPRAGLRRVDRVARQDLDGRALEPDRADHLAVAAVQGDVEPRQAPDRVQRAVVGVARRCRAGIRAAAGAPDRVAVVAQPAHRLDHRSRPRARPPRRSGSSSACGIGAARRGRARRPGTNEWISSVTNGHHRVRERERLPSTCSSVAETSSSCVVQARLRPSPGTSRTARRRRTSRGPSAAWEKS